MRLTPAAHLKSLIGSAGNVTCRRTRTGCSCLLRTIPKHTVTPAVQDTYARLTARHEEFDALSIEEKQELAARAGGLLWTARNLYIHEHWDDPILETLPPLPAYNVTWFPPAQRGRCLWNHYDPHTCSLTGERAVVPHGETPTIWTPDTNIPAYTSDYNQVLTDRITPSPSGKSLWVRVRTHHDGWHPSAWNKDYIDL